MAWPPETMNAQVTGRQASSPGRTLGPSFPLHPLLPSTSHVPRCRQETSLNLGARSSLYVVGVIKGANECSVC